MADLSFLKNDKPENLIDQRYEADYEPRTEYADGVPVERLGLSEIGHPCKRFLWYRSNQYERPVPDGRILRLFRLGNVIETEVIADLKSAGFKISGQQTSVSITINNLTLRGHIDGLISGLAESEKQHVLEVKSANKSQFAKCKKAGFQVWQPKYKVQVQSYMLAMRLDRALAVVYCKDNSELYSERIRLEKRYIQTTLKNVFRAIRSDNPPPRHCPKQDWYEARWCDYQGECWI